MSHPTPMKWMGRTLEQNQILRYIDRENPFGQIQAVKPNGPRGLIVTDAFCVDHRLSCRLDGEVICWEDREEAPPA